MNLPEKNGQMYIKVDENGKNEYGYIVNNRIIQSVVNLRNDNKVIDEFVLPDFGYDKNETFYGGTVNKAELLKIKEHFAKNDSRGYRYDMVRYLEGSVKIAEDSFKFCKNIAKNLKIVVPGDYSIRIDYGAFEDKTKCNFILKNDMDLFTVHNNFDDGFEYVHDYWRLIAHKELEDMEEFGGMRESYSFRKFETRDNDYFEGVTYSASHSDEQE